MRVEQTLSLAERKREVVRVELSTAAARLLADRHYDTITVDDIVSVAGVSRRTFFRYFPTKEDVFLATNERYGRGLRSRLAAQPADAAPMVALRAALTMDAVVSELNKSYELAKATTSVPALRARQLEHLALWRKELATALGERTGIDAATDVRPELAAAIVLAAFDVALTRWVESGDPSSIFALLDECFAPIENVVNDLLRHRRRARLRAAAAQA
jgi:AcrR family transcriptional regulator